jgi:hypothetical protein
VAASLLGNASTPDLAATPLGCVVPVLRIALQGGEAALPERINVLVDEFLAGLADRAPT